MEYPSSALVDFLLRIVNVDARSLRRDGTKLSHGY